MSTKHIIIIGAGIGGLCLGQGLKKAGISFTIFERDTSTSARSQGYRLKISPDGADVLQQSLCEEAWTLFQKSSAAMTKGVTKANAITGEVSDLSNFKIPNRAALPTHVYCVDRATMRAALMTGIESNIKFGKEFKRFTTLSDGRISVEFGDGTVEVGDLLVGADGRSSKVRRQYLPEVVPYDLEARSIYGKTPLTQEFLDKFPSNCLQNMTVITDTRPVSLFMEPVRFAQDPATLAPHLPSVQDYAYWVILFRSSLLNIDDKLFTMSKEEIKELTLSLTKDWQEPIRSIFEMQTTSQSSVLLISSAKPKLPEWTATNVTLLGDAIHPMLPTGASGANTALKDAGKLLQVIKHGASLEDIAKYEQEMREYAAVVVQEAFQGGKHLGHVVEFENAKPLVWNV